MAAGEQLASALVVGYGSIGQRHARVLGGLDCHVGVLSRRPVDFANSYSDLADALAKVRPDYVVVANSTDEHHRTLEALVLQGYTGVVLVEKPLFSGPLTVPPHVFKQVFVAYNLRFHPVIQEMRMLIEGQRLLSVHAYVGQYLPEWRPGSDYRKSYSVRAERGGGALRDLSHELDYLTWMTGQWQLVSALGGHFSPLEMDSDDIFALLLRTERCPVVTLQMNCVDRRARRFVIVNTAEHTIEADLIGGSIALDRESLSFIPEPDGTYRAMHEELLSGNCASLCTLNEGLDVLRLIEAAERSADQCEWVRR